MSNTHFDSKLRDALALSSRSRFESFFSKSGVHLKTESGNLELETVPDMVLILLSGPSIHMTLKVFFSTNDLIGLVAEIVDQKKTTSHPDLLVRDSIKELSNLIVGHIKQLLQNSQIASDISLPISMRGFDALFFKERDQQKWQWQLSHSDTVLWFEATVQHSILESTDLQYENETSSLEFF